MTTPVFDNYWYSSKIQNQGNFFLFLSFFYTQWTVYDLCFVTFDETGELAYIAIGKLLGIF